MREKYSIELKIDDPAFLSRGIKHLFDAFLSEHVCDKYNLASWLIENSPGAVTDVTEQLDVWLQRNLDRFRAAHPEGGSFDFSEVSVDREYRSEYNSEDYNDTYVYGFQLSPDGTFLFDLGSYNNYYDVDLEDDSHETLDDVISRVKGSENFNLYSVFKKILEGADSSFQCEGAFGLLSSGRYVPGYPVSSVVERKNTLPLDVLLPRSSQYNREYNSLLCLSSPNGRVFGQDLVFELSVCKYSIDNVVRIDGFGHDLLGLSGFHDGKITAGALLDKIYALVFSLENLEKIAPCYESKGYRVPTSGRTVSWEKEYRMEKAKMAYERFNERKAEVSKKYSKG